MQANPAGFDVWDSAFSSPSKTAQQNVSLDDFTQQVCWFSLRNPLIFKILITRETIYKKLYFLLPRKPTGELFYSSSIFLSILK